MLPLEPPKYRGKPSYEPAQYQDYGRHLIGEEKRFLLIISALALFTVFCTSSAIMLDKHFVTGTSNDPSLCLLTDLRCQTEYTAEVFHSIVKVCIRIDLLVSISMFVTGITLISFKMFNCKILVGFLLTGIGKTIFINVALLLIISNKVFYYNTIFNTLLGNCGHELCTEKETTVIVIAFLLLSISAFVTFSMTLVILVLGSQIVQKYNESSQESTNSKYAPIVTHFY